MDRVIDALIEVFAWTGFGASAVLGVVCIVLWASDGTWLPARAIVDRDGERPVVRWFDADGDANSAVLSDADARVLGGVDTAAIWYRHGWRGRMRLRRRPAVLRAAGWATAGLFALGVLSLVAGWVRYFAGA